MFYQNSPPSTLGKGVILTLVILGFIVGLALVNSDLVNPIKSLSQYRQDQADLEIEQREKEIDLKVYEIVQRASAALAIEEQRAEAEHRERIREEEYHHTREEHAQELALAKAWEESKRALLINGAYILVGTTSLCTVIASIGFGIQLADRGQPAQWTVERRRAAIEAARWRERQERERQLQEQRSRPRENWSPFVERNWEQLFSMSSDAGANTNIHRHRHQ